MADIAVHRKSIPHLNDVHLLAFHTQMYSALTASQTAAKNNNGVGDFVFFQVVIVDNNHVIAIHAGQIGNNGLAAHSQNQSFGLQLVQQFLGSGGIQANFHAGNLHLTLQCHAKLIHFVLERQSLLALENTAQLVTLFKQGNLMPTLCSRQGSLHAGDTAANNHNALADCRRLNIHTLALTTDQGVDGAAAGAGGGTLRHAGEAAQATNNFVVPVCHDLIGQLGISKQRTCHFHNVCLAGSDDFFHMSGIIQRAQGRHRHLDVLLDFCREIDISTVRRKHGQMGIKEAELIGTGGNVNHVNQVFHALGDFHAILQGVATLEQLGAAHTEFNGETGTDGIANAGQHFPHQTQAILKGAAILIITMVKRRGQELVQQPPMTAMNHDHLETGTLGKTGSITVSLDNILNLLLGQRFDWNPIGADPIAGTILVQTALLVLVHQISTGILTGMAQLHAGNGTVTVDGIGSPCPAGKATGSRQVQMEHMGSIRLGVHHQLTGGDGSGAALGAQLIEAGGSGTDAAVGGNIRAAHRCREHTVTESHPTQGDGLAQIGVFLNHVSSLHGFYQNRNAFCCKYS